VNVNQYIGVDIIIHKVSEFGPLTKPGLDSGFDRTPDGIGLRVRSDSE